MRLLLDQGLPRTSVHLLCDLGHDAVHVGDIDLSRASDAKIVATAREQTRIVVTLDADFHAIVALSGRRTPSVIRFRMQGLRADALARILEKVLAATETDLRRGALVTVHPDRIRVRRLPLRSSLGRPAPSPPTG